MAEQNSIPQVELLSTARGRIMALDSAYDVRAVNRNRDVVINASYCGVLPARFIAHHRPRGSIGVDCGIGMEGAGIAGLWYLEALGIPAAAADVMAVELGNGVDLYEHGVISRLNEIARDCGVKTGMPVMEAAMHFLESDPLELAPSDRTNRIVVDQVSDGRQVICVDSIAFGLAEDRHRNVLCTAGHTGRSSVPYLLRVSPLGFICSDGGRGRNDSGIAGLEMVESYRLAGATVDAMSARMGDGLSTYYDGIISACNQAASRKGVVIGQTAREAARFLLDAQG